MRLTKETLRQNLDAPSAENAVELEYCNQSMLATAPEFFEAVMKFNKPYTYVIPYESGFSSRCG